MGQQAMRLAACLHRRIALPPPHRCVRPVGAPACVVEERRFGERSVRSRGDCIDAASARWPHPSPLDEQRRHADVGARHAHMSLRRRSRWACFLFTMHQLAHMLSCTEECGEKCIRAQPR